VKVFVTGATGYVGLSVASAFRRAGHEVLGLVRSRERARRLEKLEILPVLGSLNDPGSFISSAASCSLTVHAAMDYEAADTYGLDRATVEALIASTDPYGDEKTLVYTSGTWVYGDTGGRIANEATPTAPVKRMAVRPTIERLVLDSRLVRGVVLRPGNVYGGSGGMTGEWFEAGRAASLSVVGSGRQRWAMVHVDDLADGYVKAGETGLAGEIFNLADGSEATVSQMASAAARAAGFSGDIRWISVEEASRTMGNFAECLAIDQRIDSGKAARLLGWTPKHRSFLEEVETCLASWKAAQESH
jgi:nucleoside-diphosphate-sugar epimerase